MTALEYFSTQLPNKFILTLDELLALEAHPPNRGVFLRVLDGEHPDPYYTFWVIPEQQGAHTAIHALNLRRGEVELLAKIKKKQTFEVYSWGQLENVKVIRDHEALEEVCIAFEKYNSR